MYFVKLNICWLAVQQPAPQDNFSPGTASITLTAINKQTIPKNAVMDGCKQLAEVSMPASTTGLGLYCCFSWISVDKFQR